MAIVASFNAGTKISLETDRGTAASGDKTGKMWWEGGRWFSVITDGLPSVQDAQATIFPSGHAGDRRINQQSPVVGRKWSEGNFSAPVTGDFIAPLLYAAMVGASVDMVPGAASSLMTNEPVNINPKSFVLMNQPSDGGAILRFEIKGNQTSPGGTISVCGIDAYGLGASELISAASAGMVYSRNSYSSIA